MACATAAHRDGEENCCGDESAGYDYSPLGGATVERATCLRESGILVTLVFQCNGWALTQIRDGDVRYVGGWEEGEGHR